MQGPQSRATEIDWQRVSRVLVIRLRSIGDTVLATPSLTALTRYLPHAEIDVLLEDWVAPLLAGFPGVNVVPIGSTASARLRAANYLRARGYDAVFNLHGGTTSSMLVKATGAKYRIGFSHYRYRRFYNRVYAGAADHWKRSDLHSVEQQLALLGLAGIPVDEKIPTHLAVSGDALARIEARFGGEWLYRDFALLHPAAAYDTKQWSPENFALIADMLASQNIQPVAVAAASEGPVLDSVVRAANSEVVAIQDLTLPEITALASTARIFVGNDSGIAHIAAALARPSVVIFGSSNRVHWRPWTAAPHEVVYVPFECQPCPGDICRVFGEPQCIRSVTPDSVAAAIARVLTASKT